MLRGALANGTQRNDCVLKRCPRSNTPEASLRTPTACATYRLRHKLVEMSALCRNEAGVSSAPSYPRSFRLVRIQIGLGGS